MHSVAVNGVAVNSNKLSSGQDAEQPSVQEQVDRIRPCELLIFFDLQCDNDRTGQCGTKRTNIKDLEQPFFLFCLHPDHILLFHAVVGTFSLVARSDILLFRAYLTPR